MSDRRRLRATVLQLASSAALALAVAFIIFGLLYPAPYGVLAGGTALFLIVIGSDVIIGPGLTALVADPGKPARQLRSDLAWIVAVRVVSLAFGMHAVAAGRPVLLAFEVDFFRLVSAAEVETDTLVEAPSGLRRLSWTGPTLIAAVPPVDPEGLLRAMELGLAGFDLAVEPRHWRDYVSRQDAVWRSARPLGALLERHPHLGSDAGAIAAAAGVSVDGLRFLPLKTRRGNGTVVVAGPAARVVGHLHADGFL